MVNSGAKTTRGKSIGESLEGAERRREADQLGRMMEYLDSVKQHDLVARLAYLEGETALVRSLLSAVEARDAAAEAVQREAEKKQPAQTILSASRVPTHPERNDQS